MRMHESGGAAAGMHASAAARKAVPACVFRNGPLALGPLKPHNTNGHDWTTQWAAMDHRPLDSAEPRVGSEAVCTDCVCWDDGDMEHDGKLPCRPARSMVGSCHVGQRAA
eukprot:165153-Chlamydomonas_euryale.AAC.2